MEVNEDGCSDRINWIRDSDNDGVLNEDDFCPNYRRRTPVDAKGCPYQPAYYLFGNEFETKNLVITSFDNTLRLDDIVR